VKTEQSNHKLLGAKENVSADNIRAVINHGPIYLLTKLSMKKLVFLFAVSSAVLLTSFLDKNDPDYDALAQDICDCVNESSEGISDKLKELIIQSEKDGTDLEIALQSYLMADSESATADVEALLELGDKMEVCSDHLEKKYSTIYSGESENTIIKKVISSLRATQGCEFTYAIMQLGAKAIEAGESAE
jgi:hypothetical protein